VRLAGDAAHHMLRVVGVAPGEAVELFSPDGRVAVARLVGVEGGEAVLDAAASGPGPELDWPETWLLVSVLKGPAFDAALRMATELGVTRVVPVLAERTIARGDRRPRWDRVVESAVQQCGRSRAPALVGPRPLAACLADLPAEMALRVCVPGAASGVVAQGPAAVMVGPEGGWTAAEVERAHAAGAQPMGLGPFVLRADTAVAAALSRLR
jgi:16S rRNA (uracil1498-N3)-methyltransferase